MECGGQSWMAWLTIIWVGVWLNVDVSVVKWFVLKHKAPKLDVSRLGGQKREMSSFHVLDGAGAIHRGSHSVADDTHQLIHQPTST